MKKNKFILLALIVLTGCISNTSTNSNKISSSSSSTLEQSSSTSSLLSSSSSSTLEQSSSTSSLFSSSSSSTLEQSSSTSSLLSSSSSSTLEQSSSSSSTSSSSIYVYEPIKYITVESNPLENDPYKDLTRDTFYENYTEASSYEDAKLRTEYGFISGSIDFSNGLKESNTIYSGDEFVKFGNYTYGVNMSNQIISYEMNLPDGSQKTIYKGAGYVTLEEVAAYILAFGEVPANSNYNKNKTGQSQSIAKWGKYGRVNIGAYSNDVVRYPNEPELPTKDSTGKLYQYTETDIGLDSYNNGNSITRGAYRVCFTSSYKDGSLITDVRERHVFFTGNHYYDFEEYLNYYGGWGDKFGYETGNRVSPTPYIEAKIVDKNAF